jgi:hypothetical protein
MAISCKGAHFPKEVILTNPANDAMYPTAQGKGQIPPDFVVKSQSIDVAEVIA